MSETPLQQRLMLHWSESGRRLFRNNVGVLRDARGGYVRYGLCVGSSDLIGWTPVIVTLEMVGKPIAVFTAVETKIGKRQTTTQQSRFISAVQKAGGIGCVARADDDVDEALARFTA